MKKLIALLSTIMLLLATTVMAETSAKLELQYHSGKIVIVNTEDAQSEYVLIAAQYRGDEVVKVVTYDVKPPCSDIELYNDFSSQSKIKCMMWDSVSGMKPVADAIDVTLDMTSALMSEMPSAGAGPSAMVIDEVETIITVTGNTVYVISGYIDGVEVEVTTNINTTIGILTPNVWTSSNAGRNFDAPTVWNATEAYEDVDIYTILKKGDIILYTPDGRVIAKFADANDFGECIFDGAEYNLPIGSKPNKSAARVGYYFNALEGVEVNATTTIKIKDYDSNITVASGKFIDVVTISKSNGVSIDDEGASVYDLIPYDEETKTGDYVYISTADKGQINNIIVYRFTE